MQCAPAENRLGHFYEVQYIFVYQSKASPGGKLAKIFDF